MSKHQGLGIGGLLLVIGYVLSNSLLLLCLGFLLVLPRKALRRCGAWGRKVDSSIKRWGRKRIIRMTAFMRCVDIALGLPKASR